MVGGMRLFADGLKSDTRQLQIHLTSGGKAYQQLCLVFWGKGIGRIV